MTELVRPRLRHFGTVALFLYAFLGGLGTAGGHIGFGLLIIATLADPAARHWLLNDRLNRILAGLLLALWLRAALAWLQTPELAAATFKACSKWSWLLLFPFPVWWLRGDPRRLRLVWLVALLALIGGVVSAFDWSVLGDLHEHVLSRTGFHQKIIAFSLFAATAVLGLLLLGPRFLEDQRGNTDWSWRQAARALIWFAALLFLMQALLIAQSRGAWLAVAVSFPPILYLRYRAGFSVGRLASWQRWGALTASVILALFLMANSHLILGRLGADSDTYSTILSGNLGKVPTDSAGTRIHLWNFALRTWLEHPLLGWGPGTTQALVAARGLPGTFLHGQPYDHVHNTYLELLLQFGLAGLGVALALFTYAILSALNAMRRERLPADQAYFIIGSLLLMAVWSLFDFRLLHYEIRFYMILLFASAFACRLPQVNN